MKKVSLQSYEITFYIGCTYSSKNSKLIISEKWHIRLENLKLNNIWWGNIFEWRELGMLGVEPSTTKIPVVFIFFFFLIYYFSWTNRPTRLWDNESLRKINIKKPKFRSTFKRTKLYLFGIINILRELQRNSNEKFISSMLSKDKKSTLTMDKD